MSSPTQTSANLPATAPPLPSWQQTNEGLLLELPAPGMRAWHRRWLFAGIAAAVLGVLAYPVLTALTPALVTVAIFGGGALLLAGCSSMLIVHDARGQSVRLTVRGPALSVEQRGPWGVERRQYELRDVAAVTVALCRITHRHRYYQLRIVPSVGHTFSLLDGHDEQLIRHVQAILNEQVLAAKA